jgi:RNA polymerase sigma-70 factor (ECF subfamily)
MNGLELALDSDYDIIKAYTDTKSEKAATIFVRKYQKFVYATAYRFLNSYDDADDISQEVFIKAFNNLHKFRGDSSIKTWLYKITKNICTTTLRKKKFFSVFKSIDSEENLDIVYEDKNPEEKLESQELSLKLNEAINKLPTKQRETFALRYFEDMKYDDISKLLGTSVGGIKANYFQAIQKIGKYLKKDN